MIADIAYTVVFFALIVITAYFLGKYMSFVYGERRKPENRSYYSNRIYVVSAFTPE